MKIVGVEDVGEFEAVGTVVVALVHSSDIVEMYAADISVVDANGFVHDLVVVDAAVAYQVVALVYFDPWLDLKSMIPLDIENVLPDFGFLVYLSSDYHSMLGFLNEFL